MRVIKLLNLGRLSLLLLWPLTHQHPEPPATSLLLLATNNKRVFAVSKDTRTYPMGSCLAKPKNDGDDSVHNVELAGGNVHLITTKESWDQKLTEARQDGKTVIANFSASWCGHCRMVAPFYRELSEKYPTLMFLTIDVDELTEFSTSWDIKATPTSFFLKDGTQIDKLVDANKPELQKKTISIVDSETPLRK